MDEMNRKKFLFQLSKQLITSPFPSFFTFLFFPLHCLTNLLIHKQLKEYSFIIILTKKFFLFLLKFISL